MHAARGLAIGAMGLMLVVGTAASAPAARMAAQHAGSGPEPGTQTSQPALIGAAVHLESTTVSESMTDVSVPPGRAPIQTAVTVNCPAATTCTLEADQYVQITGSTDDNRWAICTHVDGEVMGEPLCPFLGTVPNGFDGSGSFVQTTSGITPGNHKMRTYVYAKKGATVTTYIVLYRVYTS